MKIKCEIIQDLLPLYYDNVCSEDSRILIDEHLKECNDCSDYLKILDYKESEEKMNINIEEAKVNSLKHLKKQLFRKNLKVSIISIIIVLIILGIGYPLIFKVEQPISYKQDLVGIENIDDNNTKFTFLGDDFYRCHILQRTININGEEKNILMFYYTNTLWRKLMPEKQYVIGSSNYFEEKDEITGWAEDNWENIYTTEVIDEVYYYVGNYKSLYNGTKINDILDDALLLWKK